MQTGLGFIKCLTALALVTIMLAGCGGGGATDPFKPLPEAPPLEVRPATVEATSGIPVTIAVVSGVSPFSVYTSNPGVLPITQAVTGSLVTVTPNAVSAATTVTLTIRDALGREASVAVNVNPGTILNEVQVTPLANTVCGSPTPPAPVPVCSGDTASISTLVRNAGVTPVAGRLVRFDVVQGDFAFIVNPTGTSTAPSITVMTDQNGIASAVIKVTDGVSSQVAVVRATDITTGSHVDTVFTVVQQINGQAVLSVIPPSYTQSLSACNNSQASTDYIIYGGKAPYTVRNTLPSLLNLIYNGNTQVTFTIFSSGNRFTATPSSCIAFKASLVITDANGRNFVATYELN